MASAGLHATARGLAKLGSVMAGGGGHLLSPSAWADLHSGGTAGHMTFHTNTLTRGGLAHFTPVPTDQTIDKVTS